MLSICFTGHRPNKLFGYDWNTEGNQKIMKKLKKVVLETLEEQWESPLYTESYKRVTFYFGGALGIDQMAFNICKDIETEFEGEYNFILAMPFEKQDVNWVNQKDKDELAWERREANKVILVDILDKYKIKGYIEGEYYPAKIQKRNKYMVDNSDIVIAVWDGTKGGTANCVKYAEKYAKKIVRINPKEI